MIRKHSGLLAALLVVFLAGAAYRYASRPMADHSRVYRMGYGGGRPLHFQDESGNPAGLAVDMVREAARRRGIQLQWVRSTTPGIQAIQKGEADFWVLMTDLPERRNRVYITEPYIVTEYCFLVPANSPFRTAADLANARVSSPGFGIHRIRLASLLPKATLIDAGNAAKAFEVLNSGAADAVFLEQYAAGDLALNGNLSKRMRILSAPIPKGYLGLAARANLRPVADEIREEMRTMSTDGTLTPLFQGWGFFPSLNLEAIDSLSLARRRERFLIAGVAALLILLIGVMALGLRLKGQHSRLEEVESALRESEKHYRTLVELLPDSIYILTPDGGVKEGKKGTNPAPDWLLDNPGHREHVREAVASGRMCTAEEVSPDGRFLEYRLIPMRDAGGSVTGVMGILRDQTERKRSEDERARLEMQLRQAQKLESIGLLAGGIAHDFNNLLTIIMGYSKILLGRVSGEHPFAEELGQISAAGARAAGLTRQLLTFSRQSENTARTIRLDDVVAGVERMLRRLIEEHVEIVVLPGARGAFINADPGLIEQVIVNLAVNARDAMPNGGRLFIETSRISVADELASLSLSAPWGEYVCLTVTDTGIGMTPEVQARLFEPFFTTKEPGKGTGLGLSTVYGIVKQSGGIVTVHSTPGIGTSFRVLFPLSEGAAAENKEPAAVPVRGSETVLLVEDESGVRNYVKDVLEEHGYCTLNAGAGSEALEMARQHKGPIHLLLTDIVMPGMNGAEMIRQFRVLRPGVPVICTSGYPKQLRSQVDEDIPYLQKPFAPEVLLSQIRETLDRARG